MSIDTKARRQPLPVSKKRKEIFAEIAHSENRLIAGVSKDSDYTLADLTAGIGMLAAFVVQNSNPSFAAKFTLKRKLNQIAAHCLGWLDRLGQTDPLDLIQRERQRRQQLFNDGRILFDCASSIVDEKRKLRVIVEELGEIAQTIDQLEFHGFTGFARSVHHQTLIKNLISEITQVAAVAVAWLETPEGKQ